MPDQGGYDYSSPAYRRRCEERKAKAARLIAKGINPRSLKFLKLMHRR
jgi:hypothetical protein